MWPLLPLACVLALFGLSDATADDAHPSYAADIAPLLKLHCDKCHGPEKQESGLRLDQGASILSGGATGPAIVPGKSAASLLYLAMSGDDSAVRMPPESEAGPLPEEAIELFRRWIDAGAPGLPSDDTVPPAQEQQHWSFRPIARPTIPPTADESWIRNPIDAFILSRLKSAGLAPSPDADRTTLLRRVWLDLVGLPPPPEVVEEFLADPLPDAYERQVERLLASPHYGERWARLWLDQARYADSDGYSNDGPRVIWKYRDWVIDAFNDDLPFDRFVIEQLAGDLLPGATTSQLIATGFHRNTQLYSEADSATEEYRVENVVDRVHTTGVVLMGLTLGCARCHDHKFDPITQEEFFRLYAFFNNQDEPALEVDGTTTLVMRERAEPRVTQLHIRGDFTRPGREVAPGVPAVLPPLVSTEHRPTRLDLARWLMADNHPLTLRVAVNRAWQTFFGRGLVETDDDFGSIGTLPTHPELLDWLATEWRALGLRPKSLHRLIVQSSAYRQSSWGRADVQSVDPRNLLLARQKRLRLDAELIRDGALEAAGLLSHRLKGPSVFPPQPEGVMMFTQHADRTWTASVGEDRYRRGLYTFIWRLAPYAFLRLFNAPEASATCTRRDRSNTPLQALTMLNDMVFQEAAQALALHSIAARPSDARGQIDWMTRCCLARRASNEEADILERLWRDEYADAAAWRPASELVRELAKGCSDHRECAAATAVARALLNLDETMTRE